MGKSKRKGRKGKRRGKKEPGESKVLVGDGAGNEAWRGEAKTSHLIVMSKWVVADKEGVGDGLVRLSVGWSCFVLDGGDAIYGNDSLEESTGFIYLLKKMCGPVIGILNTFNVIFFFFALLMAVVLWYFRELFGAVANFCNMSRRRTGLPVRTWRIIHPS